jgi:MFS family permease
MILSLFQFIFSLRNGLIAPVLPLLMRSIGLTMTEIGLLMMVNSVAWAIFEPTLGLVADRLGKKKLMIYSVVTTSFVYVSYALARNIWHFAVIIFALASNSAAGVVSARAMMAELLPASGRGKRYGRYMAILSMGQMIGPLLGGFLSDRVSNVAPFYACGGLGVIGLVSAISVRCELGLKKESALRIKSPAEARLITKTSLGILLVRLLFMFNMSFERNTLPIFLHEHENFRASETEIGAYLAILGFTSGLSLLFLGSLADRFGSRNVMILGLATGGISWISLAFISGVWPLYILSVFQGLCFSAAEMSMMIHFMTIIPGGGAGRFMGQYGLSEDIGGMVASPFFGKMYDALGPLSSVYSVSAILVGDAVLSIFAIGADSKSTDKGQA